MKQEGEGSTGTEGVKSVEERSHGACWESGQSQFGYSAGHSKGTIERTRDKAGSLGRGI